MFELDRFKKQLAETIAWCAPRVSADDPQNSLRSILPEQVHDILDYDLIVRLIEPAIEIRAIFLETERKIDQAWKRPSPSSTLGLGGGRLLAFYPGLAVWDSAAGAISKGYFDETKTVPAWDTWVYYGMENILRGESNEPIEYLICWIPPQIIQLVDDAIEFDPTQCIEWLSKTNIPFSFLEMINSEGLLSTN